MCVEFSMCLHMLFLCVAQGWSCQAPQVYTNPFHGTVSHVTGPADDLLTCWHGHIVADPQTNHLFKRHFKRHSERQPDGAWKILWHLLFSICNHSAWFALFLLWCVKCCARFYKNLASAQMFELKKCEKWELSLSVCLYNHNTWVLNSPHQSRCIQ